MSDTPDSETIANAVKNIGDDLMSTNETAARICRQAAHRLVKQEIEIALLTQKLNESDEIRGNVSDFMIAFSKLAMTIEVEGA